VLLLVGLGNPGPKYKGNRHNIGFMAVDEIVRRHGFSPWRKRFQAEVAEGMVAGEKIIALKPQTFMNESGRAVGEAMRFLNVEGDKVYVFHDEIDLAEAKIRVKAGGGHAGNNGLRSIIQHVGPHFMRVRLGVGHPGDKDMVHPHVLSDFSKDEMTWVAPMITGIAEALPLLVKGDDASFANRVHLAMFPAEKKPPRATPAGP
jgi:peptidyl-tRNA hydrolase, PTH1 family